MELAVYDNQEFTGVVREFAEVPNLPGKPYREFYSVIRVNPAFNPITQIRVALLVTADHVAKTHTIAFEVRDKTAQELDADKEVRLDAIDALVFKVLFDYENRLRSLERFARAVNNGAAATAGIPALPNNNVTANQYRNALKNAI